MSVAGPFAEPRAAPADTAGSLGALEGSSSPACPNCSSHLVAEFCARCGERQPSRIDTTIRHIAGEVSEEFVSLDGRLWRSIVALLSRPGFLAQEYFAGRRTRYMRPFSLFLVLNVVLFFLQPYTGLFRYSYREYVTVDGRAIRAESRRSELGLSKSQFEARFDDSLRDQKKSLLLFAIPVLALVLLVMYAGSGRTYVEHLVFAVHAYAFTIFYLIAIATVFFSLLVRFLLLLGASRHVVQVISQESGLTTMLACGVISYLTFGLRRFYRSSWGGALVRATVLFAVQGFLIVAFRDLLFSTVLLSL